MLLIFSNNKKLAFWNIKLKLFEKNTIAKTIFLETRNGSHIESFPCLVNNIAELNSSKNSNPGRKNIYCKQLYILGAEES